MRYHLPGPRLPPPRATALRTALARLATPTTCTDLVVRRPGHFWLRAEHAALLGAIAPTVATPDTATTAVVYDCALSNVESEAGEGSDAIDEGDSVLPNGDGSDTDDIFDAIDEGRLAAPECVTESPPGSPEVTFTLNVDHEDSDEPPRKSRRFGEPNEGTQGTRQNRALGGDDGAVNGGIDAAGGRGHRRRRPSCKLADFSVNERAQALDLTVAFDVQTPPLRTAVLVPRHHKEDDAPLCRYAIARARGKFPHLASPHLGNKSSVAVHVAGMAALAKIGVSVNTPQRQRISTDSWILGVVYVLRSLYFTTRCREAYSHLCATLAARAGRGRRVAIVAWYDLTSAVAAAVRHAGSRAWPGDAAATVSVRKWNTFRQLLEPDFWLRFLAEEGSGRFVDLCKSMPTQAVDVLSYGKVKKVSASQSPHLGGEEHVCGFLTIVCAARGEVGCHRLLARDVGTKAAALDVQAPRDLGVASWGELSEVQCDVGGLRLAELRHLVKLPRARPCRHGSTLTGTARLIQAGLIDRTLPDFSERAMPMASPAPDEVRIIAVRTRTRVLTCPVTMSFSL